MKRNRAHLVFSQFTGPRARRHIVRSLLVSGGLVTLVAVAMHAERPGFIALLVGVCFLTGTILFWLFPKTPNLAYTTTDLISLYLVFYSLFFQGHIGGPYPLLYFFGIVAPVSGFVLGCIRSRREIDPSFRDVMDPVRLMRALRWFCASIAIALMVYLAIPPHGDPVTKAIILIVGVCCFSLIAFVKAVDLAYWNIQAGLLVEDFFSGIEKMAIPAFGFLLFYMIIIIVFGCFYAILENFSAVSGTHFLVNGSPQQLAFKDAMYFAVVTLSTLGYGDIVPVSDQARLLVSIEIITGVLLLLFGFARLSQYGEKLRRRGEPPTEENPTGDS
jgi:voltage-gated potassium channel